MELKFFSTYFEFVKRINKGNIITAVIDTDYKSNNITSQLERIREYRDAVNDLITFLPSLAGSSSSQNKDLKKLIQTVNRKANSIEKSPVSYNAIVNHYAFIANARDISYIILFRSGESWNVNFTSSLRGDRLDTHSNRFIQAKASKNYLVICSYPYQDKPSQECIKKIKQNPSCYGASINVVCLEEFMDEIMYNIFKYKENKSGSLVPAKSRDELSIVNGERGVQIEEMYATVLSNAKNFELYKKNIKKEKREQTPGSFLPNQFSIIVDRLLSDLSIKPAQVSSITATRVGASLEKADILVTITLQNGEVIEKGISVKSSSVDQVSVHEKHASDFITTLQISDPNVKNALIQFEQKRAFSKIDKSLYSALSDYFLDDDHRNKLLEWAISGECNNPLKADYILLHAYNFYSEKGLSHGIKIYSSKEYIDKIKSCDIDGTFGTHLSFTYKGNIQLKAPFFF